MKPVRYNEQRDDLDYLFDLAEKVDDPGDSVALRSARFTTASRHRCTTACCTWRHIFPDRRSICRLIRRGIRGTTRSSCFRGSALLAFDTRNDQILWWDTLIPKEGCRCLLHDEERGLALRHELSA